MSEKFDNKRKVLVPYCAILNDKEYFYLNRNYKTLENESKLWEDYPIGIKDDEFSKKVIYFYNDASIPEKNESITIYLLKLYTFMDFAKTFNFENLSKEPNLQFIYDKAGILNESK